MILRFALAALLPLAYALAPSAQPLTPADSALIETYLEASGALDATAQQASALEEMMGDAVALFPGLTDAYSPEAGLDSVRAAFARDFRRADLEAAVAFFRDPEVQALAALQNQFAGGMAEAQDLMQDLLANPDAYDLGDGDLAADFVDATGTVDRMADMMLGFMMQMVVLFPSAEAEAAAEGYSVEEYAERTIGAEFAPMLDSAMVVATRYAIHDVPPEAVQRAAAFYRSPAGVYITVTAWDGAQAASRPLMDAMVEGMAEMMGRFEDPPNPPAPPTPLPTLPCKKGSPDCTPGGAFAPVPAPPPPPPPAEGERIDW